MNSFGLQMSYASVERADGTDPRAAAREILVRLRVPAGISDGDKPWDDSQQEAVIIVPVTDNGTVLALTEADAVEASLTTARLRQEFADAGLTLWLHTDDGCCDDCGGGSTGDGTAGDGAEGDGIADDVASVALDSQAPSDEGIDLSAFEADPVKVAVFSHRGPFAARVIAQMNGLEVEHIESGSWSLARLESTELTTAGVATKAEMPVVEMNRVHGGGDWFEVTTSGGVHQFWPDAERGTVPVLDLDAITVPETAEICRRLLSEGDGSRDELAVVAAHSRLDVAAAHRALQPEALGGVVGARARREAFLAAFGIPADLIAAAFDETALDVQRFEPAGWGTMVAETLVDGMPAMTSLTRRDRPLARMATGLRRRPLIAAAVSVSELALGIAASRYRGVGRVVGVMLIIDAVVDLGIGVVRMRRRR